MTADNASTKDNALTLGALMAEAVGALHDAGIENARMDARILLSDAAGVDGSRTGIAYSGSEGFLAA